MSEQGAARFYYGWVILGIATFALIVSNGLSIGGFPVFFRPIREEFVAAGAIPADRAESFIAFGASLTFLTAGLISPFAGWFLQRFPLRGVMLGGCAMLGGGLLWHSQAGSETAVYASRVLMGASLGFVGVLANIVLVSNWFERRRGLALGILLTGTSFGGVLVPPVAGWLISAYGWRPAMAAVSIAVWALLVPSVVFLVRTRPAEMGLVPDGDARPPIPVPETASATGVSLGEAVRMPVFWILALCAALVFYPIFVTSQQFILYLQTPKIGLTPQQGGLALSALFLVSVGGKFLFGSLSDRFPTARVMLVCCSVMFLSTLLLPALSPATAFGFLVPFGLGYGGTFVLLQRLVADLFGNRDYPKILGVITVVETLGAAIGGIVTGYLADRAGGDYTFAFYAVILVTALALGLVVLLNLMLNPAPK